jgi:hypothetical protein
MSNLDLIPYRIRFGVTGHRVLTNRENLATSVEDILTRRFIEGFTQGSQREIKKASSTPVAFTIISPLAEGADRLVAQIGLAKGGLLEALLPMPRKEYERDFLTVESQREFSELMDRAHRANNIADCGLPPGDPGYRRKVYRCVGEETVARTDILIALWDGNEPSSDCGTGSIVDIAIAMGKPVFIVSTSCIDSVELINGGSLNADCIAELNGYNRMQVSFEKLASVEAKENVELFFSGMGKKLPGSLKDLVQAQLLPAYNHASLIAEIHQRRYLSTGKRAYLYSTLSVAFMAGAIVFDKMPLISLPGYMIELALLILLYLLIHRAMHDQVHHRWIENRVLAERLRMACYFVSCGEVPVASSRGKTVHHHSRSWLDLAYAEILYRLPELARPETPPIREYAKFIHEGWLEGQYKFHNEKMANASRNNLVLKKWGMRCFAMAIAVSVIHYLFAIGAAVGHHAAGWTLFAEKLLSIVAVTLPAAGAAVNGYRSIREHSRIASRSAGMVHHLERLMNRPLPADPVGLRHYLERIEDLMLMESQDWHKFMEHAELDGIA